MHLLLLLIPHWAFAVEPTVLTMDEALRLVEAASRPPKEPLPPAWTAERSLVTVTVQGDTLRVVEELALESSRSAWVSVMVLDGRVRLDHPAPAVHRGPDGNWWLTTQLDGAASFRLEGTLPRQGDATTLRVLPAARQEVRTRGEGLHFTVEGRADGFVSPRDTLAVSWRTDAPTAEVREVVSGEVAAALWWDEDALRGRARVRYEVRRGERSRFAVRVPAGATELSVNGAALLRWERAGDTLVLYSREPVRGAFEVSVEWRQPLTNGLARVSTLEPQEVSSATTTLTLAGSSETLVSPTPTGGLRPVALSELPERSRAIGDAPPAAAWSGKGALEIRTLALETIEGPPLVIDRARCTAAHADSGRALMNCRLDVRNVSRQYLVVRPGEGTELWAARVNGDGVPPVRLDGGDMAIPLEKSVETVAGLITLDVELTFLSTDEAWLRRGERELALPSFDAPVARLDWELRLPPGYEARTRGGSARTTGPASATIVYATTATTDEDAREEAARSSWNQALRAYQQNDFETAQSYVDQTILLDPDNENASRLQDNLDVLMGSDVSGGDEAMSRRVKDMAKAKVSESVVEQEESMNAAEEALLQGDYDKAIVEAEKALELSKNLSLYEQKESTEQAYRASSSSAVLERARAGKRESGSGSLGSGGSGFGGGGYGGYGSSGGYSYGVTSSSASGAAADPTVTLEPLVVMGDGEVPEEDQKVTYKQRTEIAFEDEEIRAELVGPQSQLLLEIPPATSAPGATASRSSYASGDALILGPATPTEPSPEAVQQRALLLQVLGTTGEGNQDDQVVDLFGDDEAFIGAGPTFGSPGAMGAGEASGAYQQQLNGGSTNENTYLLDGVNVNGDPGALNFDAMPASGRGAGASARPREADRAAHEDDEVRRPSPVEGEWDADGIPDTLDDGEGLEGIEGGVVGGVLGGALGGVAVPAQDARNSRDDLDARSAMPAKREEGRVGAKSPMTGAMGNSVTRSPGAVSSPASPRPNNAIPAGPALASTTLAIPLPDHGEHVSVSQSLLEPWESPTLTLRYREKR